MATAQAQTGLPPMAPGQQVYQPTSQTPAPSTAAQTKTAGTTNSTLPAFNPNATEQQKAQAKNATAKGVTGREAFTNDAAYQKYVQRATGYGPNWVDDKTQTIGDWINIPEAQKNTAQPAQGSTPTSSATSNQSGQTALPPPIPTNTQGDVMKDEGTKMLEDATGEYTSGLNNLEKDVEKWRTQDLESVQNEYNAKKGFYDESKKKLEELNQKQQEVIASGAATQKAEIEAAYKAQKANVELQKAETEKAYKEMVAAQQLANKRTEIKKETAMGILGGAFTSAGVADIESVIMEGESKVLSLQQDADLKQQGFTNQLNALVDDYKVSNMKVEQWKAESINSAYTDLQNKLMEIMGSEAESEAQKEQQIRQVNQMYNEKVSSIHADAIQVKYNLAQTVVQRSDQLKIQAQEAKDKEEAKRKLDLQESNQTRDDARTALQNMITTLPGETFQNLSEEQKQQIRELEKQAGYPVGLTEQGIKTFKEESQDQKEVYQNANLELKQKMLDLKEKMGDKVQFMTDENGNVTAVTYDPSSNQFSTQPLGNMGKASPQFGFTTDPEGNIVATNKYTGGVGDAAFSGGGAAGGGGGPLSNAPVSKPTSSGSTKNFTSTAVGGQTIPPDKFAEIFKCGTKQGWCGNFASTISTAPKVGNSWAEKKSKITHTTNPKPGDKIVLPWGVDKNGKGYGHVMVVLEGDKGPPETVNVVQSNADGRQNKNPNNPGIVTQATYNLDEWNRLYGKGNWGFVRGSFKPEIQKKLNALKTTKKTPMKSVSPEAVAKVKAGTGKPDTGFKAAGKVGGMFKDALANRTASQPKNLSYEDALNEAQQLYGKSAVPKAKIQWMKKNLNNGNIQEVRTWLDSLKKDTSKKKTSGGSKYKIDLSSF